MSLGASMAEDKCYVDTGPVLNAITPPIPESVGMERVRC